MPTKTILALTALLAGVVIVAFALMLGSGMWEAWGCTTEGSSSARLLTEQRQEEIDDPFTYVATALGVLVGGIVAVAFGQPAPAAFGLAEPRSLLLSIYAFVYVLVGLAAIVTWVALQPQCTPLIVRNLATTFLGLLLPVVANFLRVPRAE